VVELCNSVSANFLVREDLERSALPFEVEFDVDTDALTAVRAIAPPGPALIRLTVPPSLEAESNPSVEAIRSAEAEALARQLAAMLSDPAQQVVPRQAQDGASRMIRGGDVAVLFQRFTQLETYRQALVRHGVRHRIVRGRGFYAAQEVVDLASLLQLVGDPSNAIAFAGILRSPLVALSDASLVSLALRGGQVTGLDPVALLVRGEAALDALAPDERSRLSRFLETYALLRRERDRLGLRQLLRTALDALDLEARLAGAPFGEQAIANLHKLLELAAARDRRGVPAAAFARELLELADSEPKEAQGDVLGDGDLEAVTLLTAHQAKGLEWPVIVLPELFTPPPGGGERIRFDRDVGLAVAPLANEPVGSTRYLQCKTLKTKREAAQRRRLLYVALTRARDRVVLGFLPSKPRSGTWASWLPFNDIWFEQFHGRGAAIDVDVEALPAGTLASAVERVDAEEEVRGHVARARARTPVTVRDAALPVTQLQDFVTCPRRYQLAHQIGLAERPLSFEWNEEPGEDVSAGDPRRLGIATHKLLELTPLEWVGLPDLRARLHGLQRSSGIGTENDDAVIDWAHDFWNSSFGRTLPAARRVLRELPFVLRLGDEHFSLHLRGQIDLLVVSETVDVIDFKTSVPSEAGLEPYAFQLGCYALAARRFLESPALELRAGVSFLRSGAEPRFLDRPIDAGLEATLVKHARALVEAQAHRSWPLVALSRCKAVGCGYRQRCHGSLS
jgi:ATP-dependent exoDNAse (exonuclease V) beta subunit